MATAKSSGSGPAPRLAPWLDIAAIALWGGLFIKYWLTNQLFILIHPKYMGLTLAAAFAMLLLAGIKGWKLWRQRRSVNALAAQHLSLLPAGWGTTCLLVAGLVALLVQPQPFASQKAIQRGATDSAFTLTRVKPQSFRAQSNPESRSILDWVRTLTAYPEPDAYSGQKVKVQGFVIHPPNLPPDHLLISRFVITCCAADTYPVTLPVKLKDQPRTAYPPDQWFEVEGQMATETLENKRQVVVHLQSAKSIPAPKNPYEF
jgi:uncharacterized repeat protein (TIGR03943 family)